MIKFHLDFLRKKFKTGLIWFVKALPLAGAMVANLFPLKPLIQQFLILIVLVWFYVFFLFDTFFLGG